MLLTIYRDEESIEISETEKCRFKILAFLYGVGVQDIKKKLERMVAGTSKDVVV